MIRFCDFSRKKRGKYNIYSFLVTIQKPNHSFEHVQNTFRTRSKHVQNTCQTRSRSETLSGPSTHLKCSPTVFRKQRLRPFLKRLHTYSTANGRESASASEKKVRSRSAAPRSCAVWRVPGACGALLAAFTSLWTFLEVFTMFGKLLERCRGAAEDPCRRSCAMLIAVTLMRVDVTLTAIFFSPPSLCLQPQVASGESAFLLHTFSAFWL